MKRLQIIQSSLEPDKNVLWIDSDKKLKIYNGGGWESLFSNPSSNVDINDLLYNDNSLKDFLDELNSSQVDWEEKDSTSRKFIQNKPILSKIAKTGSFNDLHDIPNFANPNYTVKNRSEIISCATDSKIFNIYKYWIYNNLTSTKYSLINLPANPTNFTNTYIWDKTDVGDSYLGLLYYKSATGTITLKVTIEERNGDRLLYTHSHYFYILFNSSSEVCATFCTTLSWEIILKQESISVEENGTDEIYYYAFLKVPYEFTGTIKVKPVSNSQITVNTDIGILNNPEEGNTKYYSIPKVISPGETECFLYTDISTLNNIPLETLKYPYGKYEVDFINYFGTLSLEDNMNTETLLNELNNKVGNYV